MGFIYKITSNHTDKIYIGATKLPLQERLHQHEKNYKKYINGKYNYVTSYFLLELGDYKIKKIEELKTDDIKTLRDKERYYLRKYFNNCVNQHPY